MGRGLGGHGSLDGLGRSSSSRRSCRATGLTAATNTMENVSSRFPSQL